MINQPSAEYLWNLPSHNFNEWRANNDLPLLFSFFRRLLPGFSDWLDSLSFGEDVALRIVPTGSIFKGGKKTVIKRSCNEPGTYVIECFEGTIVEAKARWERGAETIEIIGEIEPYFKWAKKALGRKRFFSYDDANPLQITDTFLYGSWHGLSNNQTVAHLFKDFAVLKLGQVVLTGIFNSGPRNLDFTDLDFLTITKIFPGSYWTTISYSSCRKIFFHDVEIAFFTFHQCSIENFYCKNSRLQDFYFERNLGYELKLNLTDSFVHNMGFKGTPLLPLIDNCELRNFNYDPPEKGNPHHIATTYRLLRSAYQSSGMRSEASECYYKERMFERKSYFHPYMEYGEKFSSIAYGGRISQVIASYNSGYLDDKTIWRAVFNASKGRLKLWLCPKFLLPLLNSRIKWLTSMLESVIWGYGERPSRIIINALILISGYTFFYHYAVWSTKDNRTQILDWIDSAYFSIVTFTTLGYGDITPTTTTLKLLCGSEAILGAFTMGLIVAGFSNRSRY
ncbi:potassium channel family protein [Chromobacterium vaccinii]|uniref:potassium channel family protein n=1 Tax=Chromobacterium vaccinii TaxID=1108595 RepID=UPI001E5197C8|nr:potassium channel family protein [Chromobacterium vaccinii]MCD4500239.1 potassium channel family protein [Chromobacterium vaccinii]